MRLHVQASNTPDLRLKSPAYAQLQYPQKCHAQHLLTPLPYTSDSASCVGTYLHCLTAWTLKLCSSAAYSRCTSARGLLTSR